MLPKTGQCTVVRPARTCRAWQLQTSSGIDSSCTYMCMHMHMHMLHVHAPLRVESTGKRFIWVTAHSSARAALHAACILLAADPARAAQSSAASIRSHLRPASTACAPSAFRTQRPPNTPDSHIVRARPWQLSDITVVLLAPRRAAVSAARA